MHFKGLKGKTTIVHLGDMDLQRLTCCVCGCIHFKQVITEKQPGINNQMPVNLKTHFYDLFTCHVLIFNPFLMFPNVCLPLIFS